MRISPDTLQLVSYVNIFVVGAIAALVINRVFAKFWPHDHSKQKKKVEKSNNDASEHNEELGGDIDPKVEAAVDRMLSTEPIEDKTDDQKDKKQDSHETTKHATEIDDEVAESAKTFDEQDAQDKPTEPVKPTEHPEIIKHDQAHDELKEDEKPEAPEEHKETTPAPTPVPTPAPTVHAAHVSKPSPSVALSLSGHLAPEIKQHLIAESHEHFSASLEKTTGQLEHDLQAVTDKLAVHLDKLGSTVINTEMERYSKQLERLRHQAETAISGAQAGIDKHQANLQAELETQRKKLEAHMNEEIAAEKKRMAEQLKVEQQKVIDQIDAKLGDAVASFLTETLQHNVDLGAQNNYLIAMLEEHKDDFKREVGVSDDASA